MKTKLLGLFMAIIMVICAPVPVQAEQVKVTEDDLGDFGGNVHVDENTIQEMTKASNSSEIYFPKSIVIAKGYSGGSVYWISNKPKKGKIKDLKISDKTIASVAIREKGIWIKPKKAGKTTFQFSLKYGSKVIRFTTKLTVYNYKNPLKSFKMNGKEIKAGFKKDAYYTLKNIKPQKCKFDIQVKEGWNISCISYGYKDKFKNYYTNPVTIGLKKDKRFYVVISLYNKKTGLDQLLFLYFQ